MARTSRTDYIIVLAKGTTQIFWVTFFAPKGQPRQFLARGKGSTPKIARKLALKTIPSRVPYEVNGDAELVVSSR